MAIEFERTIVDGMEQIVATGDSGDETALQRFTEQQNASGFDIGPGNAVLDGGMLRRIYTRPTTEADTGNGAEAEAESADLDVDAGMDITDGALAFAEENGVELTSVVGSGAGGRIIMKDVKAALAAAAAAADTD